MNAQPLWEHQKQGIVRGLADDSLLLAFEMGTGKTRTTIEILRRRYAERGVMMKTIIFAPLITLQNWKSEILQFSKISDRDILVLNQSGAARAKKFYDFCLDVPTQTLNKPRIIITNYEAALMKDFMKFVHEWEPEILICDESHRCKNVESKRAKAIVELSDKAKFRYLLTGTPILNTAMDLFNQFRILDRGATFGKNFFAFRNMWFEDENAGWNTRPGYFPKYTPRPQTYGEFHKMVSRKTVRALKSECLDLPDLVKMDRHVSLSKEQLRMYAEMREEYLTFIKDKLSDQPRAVVAQLAITKALRLQQIISGFAKDDEGRVHWIEDNPRIDALKELLEDLVDGHKVIVWAVFKENYKMIAAMLNKMKVGYAELHGDISASDKEAMIKKFRTDPKCRVMIANQAAGGIGINLIEASYAIYYSRNFSLEQDMQSEARNYRGGSHIHEKITRINLVAPESIDELISEALATKQEIGTRILDWKV